MLLIFLLSINILSANLQNIDPTKRIDCHPDPNVTETSCDSRGCIFDSNLDPSIHNPICYYPPNTGYIAEDSIVGNTITLKKSLTSVRNPFEADFDELIFQSNEIGSGLHITITPKNQTRYRPLVPINSSPNILSTEKLNVLKNNDTIFSFTVQRQSSGAKIWDTSIGGLLFSDKFLQIATFLPSNNIYGFGEHEHTSLKHNLSTYTTWGIWAKSNGEVALNKNLYGVHPFYLGLENDGNAHGVFIFNSNAQEVTLGPAPHLVYRTIGGQFEFFFFPGPTPEQVIQQYQQVIGTPFLPSYWALGFQICRFGYSGTNDVQIVVNRTLANNIPFDVAWADIDYMNRYKDFTLDSGNWADFGNYTNYLHSQGMHVILIADPGIEVDYDSFQRGLDQNASFIEWPRLDMVPKTIENQYPLLNGSKIMLGVVWPDKHVAFPDFLDPSGQTNQWWVNEWKIFHDNLVPLDGIWIDANEPAIFNTNFYNSTGIFPQIKSPTNESLSCPITGNDSTYDSPPYYTHSGYYNGPYLASGSLCMCALTARETSKFFDTKCLYGWSESVASNLAQKQAIGIRGAVISRSTYPSSGHYAGHWTGDNHATWEDLKNSIITIQEFNIFGIPLIGADICGFHSNTTEELCLRWQQLGAFYPFSRNHNDEKQLPQDPSIWPDVAAATRKANLFRYRHLPYLYSLFVSATYNGGTVVRPVFFEFSNDVQTYDLSFQFLWGPALMVIPVLYPNVSSTIGYLPNGSIWYSVYDYFYGTKVNNGLQEFPAPTDYLIPVFVRGGCIVPRQKPSTTTVASRMNEFQLLIALDQKLIANGQLYWDDGDTLLPNDDYSQSNHYHFLYNFTLTQQKALLLITQFHSTPNLTLPTLDNIEIFGYSYQPDLNSLTLNGAHVNINQMLSSYSPFTQVLNITASGFIDLNKNGPNWILEWNN